MAALVPSSEAVSESIRLSNMSELEICQDYLKYSALPYGESISIDKIAILNFNPIEGKDMGSIRYLVLRELKPEEFPPCQDPEMDYEDTDQVTPTLIITPDGVKYRAPMLIWHPLSDIVRAISKKQGKTGKRILPVQVHLDEGNQWMCALFNLVSDEL